MATVAPWRPPCPTGPTIPAAPNFGGRDELRGNTQLYVLDSPIRRSTMDSTVANDECRRHTGFPTTSFHSPTEPELTSTTDTSTAMDDDAPASLPPVMGLSGTVEPDRRLVLAWALDPAYQDYEIHENTVDPANTLKATQPPPPGPQPADAFARPRCATASAAGPPTACTGRSATPSRCWCTRWAGPSPSPIRRSPWRTSPTETMGRCRVGHRGGVADPSRRHAGQARQRWRERGGDDGRQRRSHPGVGGGPLHRTHHLS